LAPTAPQCDRYRLAAQVLLFLERLDYLRLVRAYEEKMLAATMDQLAQSQCTLNPLRNRN
jgi:hypothetical protein